MIETLLKIIALAACCFAVGYLGAALNDRIGSKAILVAVFVAAPAFLMGTICNTIEKAQAKTERRDR